MDTNKITEDEAVTELANFISGISDSKVATYATQTIGAMEFDVNEHGELPEEYYDRVTQKVRQLVLKALLVIGPDDGVLSKVQLPDTIQRWDHIDDLVTNGTFRELTKD